MDKPDPALRKKFLVAAKTSKENWRKRGREALAVDANSAADLPPSVADPMGANSKDPGISAGLPDSVKVLVSRAPIHFTSHRSAESVVFDREICSGIFVPSKCVHSDLAEEYRSIPGTLGVMVYGSWVREMTLKEIHDLKPDDPETVDSEMLHRRGRNSEGIYDVLRFGTTSVESPKLSSRTRADLKRAIGKQPSDEFFRKVEECLGHYLWDQEQVKNARPSRVHARIAGVVQKIDALLAAIDELQPTDWDMIESAKAREWDKGRRTIAGNEILGRLMLYRRHVTEAENRLARSLALSRGKGRMHGYADRLFATSIAQLVCAETGKRPGSTRARERSEGRGRGSTFTQVLTILLSLVSNKPRTNVEALARHALKT